MTTHASDTSHKHPVRSVITPPTRNLGDFEVRRALPAPDCRSVGPFVFFDHFGPVVLPPGQGLDVRPHPHIGLSTISWLFDGEIRHQDSLGYDLVIRPGAVNWMTAGRGIVHSERSPHSARATNAALYGIQAWMALPRDKEEMEPAFYHYPAIDIPRIRDSGLQFTLIAGAAFGLSSPVHTESSTFYAELRLQAGHSLAFPIDIEERAIYICEGSIELAGTTYTAGNLLVLKPAQEARITAVIDCLCMLLGGAPLDAPRLLYWNFVSSRPDRIEQAKNDWKQGRFEKIPGDDEFIPLPD